jgi:HSP20 family molecular chaperone IbpA
MRLKLALINFIYFLRSDFNMLDLLFNPFAWNKEVYQFNRLEKDMKPYSVHKNDNGVTLVHNVVGVDKKDLSVKLIEENGISKLVIEGETEPSIDSPKSKYSVHSEFILDNNKKIEDISSKLENGLLYITIKYEEPTEGSIKTINIQ